MEDFVSFEIAKKLKEKGFREECFAYYGYCDTVFHFYVIQNPVPSRQLTIKDFKGCKNCYAENLRYDAPTISKVLKWLREEKKIYLELVIVVDAEYMCDIYKIDARPIECLGSTEYSKTYEAAALAGIEYVLDNLI